MTKRKRIYTKRGDEGETGLLYGGRVSKTDPHCEAYGAVDETVSAIGLARALSRHEKIKELLFNLQKELFTVGAELATLPEYYDKLTKHFDIVTPEMVVRLERLIDELEEEIGMPREFIMPGTTAAGAAMDMARTAIRRAERRALALKDGSAPRNREVLKYLNRLSDLFFMLARYEDKEG
ncbi:MAG: cob(I)yrinic acid a,c-diamide adenosyltransferase [Dehalococcoidia bacterium]